MISISCKLRTTIAVTALMALFACAGCRKARTDPFPGSGVVAGWQKTSDTHAYAAKDLWQYIDGEAEQYISAGVVSASTSDYKYQDGLAYYESTRDTASHFFIDYLPKGTYVFEYSTRVQLRGRYQTGVAEIQCMYAPEFNSHSESIPLAVK